MPLHHLIKDLDRLLRLPSDTRFKIAKALVVLAYEITPPDRSPFLEALMDRERLNVRKLREV